MVVFRSEVATPTVFVSEAIQGINYVLRISGDIYIATVTTGGVIVSTDRGASWGPVLNPGTGPLGTIFKAQAGRLIFSSMVTPSNKMYISDDNGTTITSVAIGDYNNEPRGRGEKIIQTVGAFEYIWARPLHQYGTLFQSADNGNTFARVDENGVAEGAGLEIRGDGAVYGYKGTATGFEEWKTVDEAVTIWTEVVPAYIDGASMTKITLRSGYHIADDVIGIAMIRNSGGVQSLTFVTINAAGVRTKQWESGDLDVAVLNHCTAIQGTSGKWVISANTGTDSIWFICDDGDPTTWTELKRQQIADAGEGILGNLIDVV